MHLQDPDFGAGQFYRRPDPPDAGTEQLGNDILAARKQVAVAACIIAFRAAEKDLTGASCREIRPGTACEPVPAFPAVIAVQPVGPEIAGPVAIRAAYLSEVLDVLALPAEKEGNGQTGAPVAVARTLRELLCRIVDRAAAIAATAAVQPGRAATSDGK